MNPHYSAKKIVAPYLCVFAFFLLIISCKESKSKDILEVLPATETLAPLPDSLQNFIMDKVKSNAVAGQRRVVFKVGKPGEMASYFGYDGRGDSLITRFNINYEIGSNSKMFTATAIMQLIEQGKIALETPLTKILPDNNLYDGLLMIGDMNYIDSVKVKNLLNHTSGMPDYFLEEGDEAEIKKNGDASLVFSTQDLISMSKRSKKERFAPDTKFEYSNINYIFLGEIIKKITGQSYSEYIQEHILDKLGMEDTYFGSVKPPQHMEQGHFKGVESEMPYTMAGPAGDIISTLYDMFLFTDAWFTGKLFKNPETLHTVLNDYFHDMGMGLTYGLGVINMQNKSWGHEGQTFGFQAYSAATPNGYCFVGYMDDAEGSKASMWMPAIALSSYLMRME